MSIQQMDFAEARIKHGLPQHHYRKSILTTLHSSPHMYAQKVHRKLTKHNPPCPAKFSKLRRVRG